MVPASRSLGWINWASKNSWLYTNTIQPEMKLCIFSPNFFAFPTRTPSIRGQEDGCSLLSTACSRYTRLLQRCHPCKNNMTHIRVVSSGLMECYSKEQMGVKHVRRLIQLKSLSAAPRRLLEVHVKEQRFRSLTAKTKLMPGIQMARQQINGENGLEKLISFVLVDLLLKF